jgi:A/G-specific adenine glycosylase
VNIADLQRDLLGWYRRQGRADLPWRVVRDPYYTVVSEFMLQQTQVDRVVPKFAAFVERFRDFSALAAASTADVIRQWKGLGYNSRAVRLKRLAQAVVERHAGVMPSEIEVLRALPGVGPYTAAAIAAFAFDQDAAACDTNVRRVVHRLAFGVEFPPMVSTAKLDGLARELVPQGLAHDWNSAMMDLGATICTARAPKCLPCPLRATCVAAPIDAVLLEAARKAAILAADKKPAPRFEKTTRYARGRIVDRLRELPPEHAISLLDLRADLQPLLPGRSVDEVDALVAALARDGVVESANGEVRLRV